MSDIKVMLVDDHELMRQGLRAILQMEQDINVIDEVGSGPELLNKIDQGIMPDLVLMDVHMPGMSGVAATQRLKTKRPNVKVIGLTAVEEEETAEAMRQVGASCYLSKTSAASELVKTIRQIFTSDRLGRDRPFVHKSANDIDKECISHDHVLETGPRRQKERLTRRELEVMRTLMKGYSNKEIARILVISERTVHAHLSNIFAKMNVHSRTEAVLVAMRDGWIPVGQTY